MSENKLNEMTEMQPEEEMDGDEFQYLTIDFEDGGSEECEILGTFECDGKEYIALLPVGYIEDEVGDVYLYGFRVEGEKEMILIDIDDEDQFEKVSQEFYKMAKEYLL